LPPLADFTDVLEKHPKSTRFFQKAITSRRLKQAEAAKVLRVTQPRVSDLLRGRIDLFSTDALIDMLASLGVGVRLVVKPGRPKKVA